MQSDFRLVLIRNRVYKYVGRACGEGGEVNIKNMNKKDIG